MRRLSETEEARLFHELFGRQQVKTTSIIFW